LLGRELGVSTASIIEVWHKWDLQPWRRETFKFSTDPQLEAKLTDIVGLYLHPPENAVVVCIDEKSQIQALDRTQPILPLRPGLPERATHDYIRHGITTLFAALDVATGQIVDACYPRHRHQEFLRFLKKVAAAWPGQQLHVVCDNYATHNHPEVRAWLAKTPPGHLALHPHQLLLAEHGGDLLDHHPPGHPPRRRCQRGRPQTAIRRFIDAWNDRCQSAYPFMSLPDEAWLERPWPRRSCATARQPFWARNSSWPSQASALSGQPCENVTGGPWPQSL
jgi:hypothetical protein